MEIFVCTVHNLLGKTLYTPLPKSSKKLIKHPITWFIYFQWKVTLWEMDAVKNFVFPNAASQPDDGVAWWLKYACKAAGILSGIGMFYFSAHIRPFLFKIFT